MKLIQWFKHSSKIFDFARQLKSQSERDGGGVNKLEVDRRL